MAKTTNELILEKLDQLEITKRVGDYRTLNSAN